MSDAVIRPYRPADRGQAAGLWNRVFGDPEEVVCAFLDLFGTQSGFCMVADCSGTIAAAAYAMDGLTLCLPGQPPASGTYLYAVATDPEFRKRGLAAEICRALRDAAFARGIDCLFTHPAEMSLFPWYAEKIGAAPVLPCRTRTVTDPDAALPVSELSPAEYGRLRERLLADTPHVAFPDTFLAWEHRLHAAYGGAFLRVGDGIADVFTDGKTAEIAELLHDAPECAARAVLAHCGARTARVTLPGGDTPYISCAPASGTLPAGLEQAWFGPVFG